MAEDTQGTDTPTTAPINVPDKPALEGLEDALTRRWLDEGTYKFNPDTTREQVYSIDTPPPTASGSLHVGHMFSYTQTDVLARYQRMTGKNVFYPMGWDDNGLPTERRVQNYYHVRCEPSLPYEPGLSLPMADDATRKTPPRHVSRRSFIELCETLTRQDEEAFKQLWQRLGLSVDWTLEYSTIAEHSRRIAQTSFLDLHAKQHVYNVEAPVMWDVDFGTAVAQAEVEDRPRNGAFHNIRFAVEGGGEFVIATTRPELLPACVAVAAHPEDERYRGLFGKRALTPVFHAPVTIFASDKVDKEKGTGILMVCTFGDATDVLWWREQGLPLRQIIGRDGRLQPAEFGEGQFPSLQPEAARQAYARLQGQRVGEARKQVVEMLRDPVSSAAADGRPPLVGEPQPVEHAVKFYEKGERPLEFVTTRQWFVRLVDKKGQLVEAGERVQWHPDFMRKRFRDWTENLQFDWCVSRQRYFGVPIPVWYPVDDAGQTDFARPILPDAKTLPVDPMVEAPPGYDGAQRDQPGGFRADPDVFDTWFTSSMSPQIVTGWPENPERHRRLFPMDLRPQSHEIIRTWAFYTIAKALLHEGDIPWRHAAISGWVLDPDRKKMSKSKGNVLTPAHLLDEFGSDAVRYWALSAKLGVDTTFDEKVLKVGRRLVVKLFNLSKFVLAQSGGDGPVVRPIDRGFLARLRTLVVDASQLMEDLEHARAMELVEQFFWSRFTDTYVEMVKARARSDEDPEGRASAVGALRLGLKTILRLFAPFLPYITEEAWSWSFGRSGDAPTIHRAAWPTAEELDQAGAGEQGVFDAAVGFLDAVHRAKGSAGASVGRHLSRLRMTASPATAELLRRAMDDVLSAARVQVNALDTEPNLKDGVFEVVDLELAEPTPAPPGA
jgi:valyl-tRNA synthetase